MPRCPLAHEGAEMESNIDCAINGCRDCNQHLRELLALWVTSPAPEGATDDEVISLVSEQLMLLRKRPIVLEPAA